MSGEAIKRNEVVLKLIAGANEAEMAYSVRPADRPPRIVTISARTRGVMIRAMRGASLLRETHLTWIEIEDGPANVVAWAVTETVAELDAAAEHLWNEDAAIASQRTGD